MNGKTIAIIAHIPLIGWLISWIINIDKKDEFARFYNRQMLGVNILWYAGLLVPLVGWIFDLGIFIFWIISLAGVFKGEKKIVPYIGKYFQNWFKSM